MTCANLLFFSKLKNVLQTGRLLSFNMKIPTPMKFIWNDQENLKSLQNRN